MAELKADVHSYLPNRRPTLVYLFLLTFTLVYLFTLRDSSLLFRFGVDVFAMVFGVDVVRFITAIFVHADALHLFLNCLALWLFGRDMERIFGQGRFLAIFFLSGIGGNLLSYLVRSAFGGARVSVGASGAIFGIIGMHLVYFWRYRYDVGEHGNQRLQSAIAILAVNIVQGLIRPGIDNWGHIGGALTGVTLAYYLLPRYDLIPAIEAERWLDRTKPRDYLKPLMVTALLFTLLTWVAIPQSFVAMIWPFRAAFSALFAERARELSPTLLHTFTDPAWDVAFSADSQMLVILPAWGDQILLWHLPDGRLLRNLSGHGYADASRAIFAADDSLLVTSHSEGIWLWRVSDGEWLDYLRGGTDSTKGVITLNDGVTLIAAVDEHVGLWQLKPCQGPDESCAEPLPLIQNVFYSNIRAFAMSPIGDRFAAGGCTDYDYSGCVQGKVHLRQLDGILLHELSGHTAAVTILAFTPDGARLLSGGLACGHLFPSCSGSDLMLWSATDGRLLQELSTEREAIVATFSPDGRFLAAGLDDGRVWLWELGPCDLSSDPCLETAGAFQAHPNAIIDLAYSPDGTMLASASANDGVKVWAVESLMPINGE